MGFSSFQIDSIITVTSKMTSFMDRAFISGTILNISWESLKQATRRKEHGKAVVKNTWARYDKTRGMGSVLATIPQARFTKANGTKEDTKVRVS